VFTVGPRLHDLYTNQLSVMPGTSAPVEINPGFDDPDVIVRTPPPGRPREVLVLGRLEDAGIKGIDIAARGLAHALDRLRARENEAGLILRGVPADQHKALYEQVNDWSGRRFRPVTRSFTTNSEDLRADLHRAVLLPMPSRAEAFGLVAAEAIACGTPVLVSERSGLAQFLHDRLPAEEYRRLVVPVHDDEQTDAQSWGEAIMLVLHDVTAAFARAGRLRQVLAEQQTWAMAADTVLGQFRDPAPTPASAPASASAPAGAPSPDVEREHPPKARQVWRVAGLIAGLAVLATLSTVALWPEHTYPEIAANRLGSPLYTDAGSTPVADGSRIPFQTKVEVRCKVPDTTGMDSVSYWYHLASDPYENLFSPSDTFANGDSIPGGTTVVDRAVPDCASGTGVRAA
jgi:hypothetical protein